MAYSNGELLCNEVKGIVESIASELEVEVKVLHELKMSGYSTIWTPDIVVAAKHVIHDSLFDNNYSLYLVIIECKYIGEHSAQGVYWDAMSRAYMELNDLKLNQDLASLKFYLIVNRYGGGSRNYHEVFENIGVTMINLSDLTEQATFEEQIRTLIRDVSSEKQFNRLKELFKKIEKEDATIATKPQSEKMSRKVTVWLCEVHREMEILKDIKRAYCPECGREMKKVGEYWE